MTTSQAHINLEQGKATYPDHLFEEWEVEINILRDDAGKVIDREYIKKQLRRKNVKLKTEEAIILNASSTGQPHGMLAHRYYEQEKES